LTSSSDEPEPFPTLAADSEADSGVSSTAPGKDDADEWQRMAARENGEPDTNHGRFLEPNGIETCNTPASEPVTLTPTEQLVAATDKVRRVWGHDSLRPQQEDAMAAFLSGQDVLLVLPTGGGKSLCYQAPALVRGGLTLVVSPLISLMKDQVDGLLQSGVRAGMIASTQDPEEQALVQRQLNRGELDLLYCSPERLTLPGFVPRLVKAGLTAIAVDEAHCISHWGHDFRPDYRELGDLRQHAPGVPMMAVTATAPPRVRVDIVAQLNLQHPVQLVGDFDRPNLTYRAQPRGRLLTQIQAVIQRHSREAGIIYALRRTDTEDLARDLATAGIRVGAYHAGLSAAKRKEVQENFLAERIDVVVATVAFGMGIDRSDVRFVIHASLPKGIEQYSQETGRAGRDGLAAECVLFYGGSDHHTWKRLMERSAEEAAATGVENAKEDLIDALERLGQMWGLAASATCRHRTLVEHFGGAYNNHHESSGCGACDVCLGELETLTDAGIVAQKILSCVVRCDQRYGAAHVTDVLRGAKTQRMRDTDHDKLSTYGLLKDLSARELRGLIDQLIAQGHLGVASGEFPTLFLTQSGARVMKAEDEVTLLRPKRPTPSSKRKALQIALDDTPVAQDLFELLRKKRRKLAAEREIPPYLIANDRTLTHLAAHHPKTQAELLATPGIGEKKALDLGPIWLEIIRDWLSTQAHS
jgi:ATP-dependent DNA helicase RecQ